MLFKKKIILGFVLLLIVQTITAQYRLGITSGLNVSNHTGKDFPSTNIPRIGYAFGFFYEHRINSIISIVAEPLYEQKGAEYTDYPRFDTRVTVNGEFDYLTVPLMIKASFSKRPNNNRKAKFTEQLSYYITGGLSISYLSSYSNEVHAYDNDFEINSDTFFPYTYNNIDVSVSVGGGVMWREIFLDLRYIHGMSSLYKGSNVPEIRNHLISLKLAFVLFGKKVIPCRKRR
ncbi:MAG: hypothetical protein B6I20_14745 [Bacteroidetes bacterium 4572_117]|nr:MAG: hypothetical protein B6I20_14745 [Bacteroidetes bacterium 4572_117]